MASKVYDTIIVGAGPSGSTVSTHLARRGYRVLVLEKQRHPRYKVCGGGLSVRVDRLLGQEYHEVLDRRVSHLVMTCGGDRSFTIPFESPIAYMMMRDRFDAYLMNKARAHGCDVREDEPAVRIRCDDGVVQVRTTRGEYQARTIIGADGIPSLVMREIFPRRDLFYAVGLESESVLFQDDRWTTDSVLIDIGAIRNGYAWIFPKRRHLSCGVATFHRDRQNMRQSYSSFIQSQPVLSPVENHHTAGHLIPHFSSGIGFLVHGRALVVGDAAGLVDPFLGEGIYYAIRSGQLAADAVIGFLEDQKPLSSYADAIEKEIYQEFRAASRIAWIVYRLPRLVFKLSIRHPGWLEEVGRILQGRSSYQDLWGRLSDLRRWFGRVFR
jgi:geranylgeranyl reductase family protein